MKSHLPSLSIFYYSITFEAQRSPSGCAGNKKNIPLGVASTRQRCETAVLVFLLLRPSLSFFSSSITLKAQRSPSGCAGNKKNIPLGLASTRQRSETAVLVFLYLYDVIFSRPCLAAVAAFHITRPWYGLCLQVNKLDGGGSERCGLGGWGFRCDFTASNHLWRILLTDLDKAKTI